MESIPNKLIVPAYVNGDPKKFYQLCWNMLERAIGQVFLEMRVTLWIEMKHDQSGSIGILRGAKLTEGILFC